MPKRRNLASALRDDEEDDLADRALLATDDEMDRIAILAAHYAFSAVAMEHGAAWEAREHSRSPHSMFWSGPAVICAERGPREK